MTHIAEKASPNRLSAFYDYFEIRVSVGHGTVGVQFQLWKRH